MRVDGHQGELSGQKIHVLLRYASSTALHPEDKTLPGPRYKGTWTIEIMDGKVTWISKKMRYT